MQKTPIIVELENNKLLEEIVNRVNESEEVKTLWHVINVNAIDRLGMTDHGPTHFKIVANNALTILRLLSKSGVETSIVKNFGLTYDHAEVVVFLAAVFHDLGMSINRAGHEEFSLILANNLMREMLDFLPIVERTIVISEALHAIISHRSGGNPITIEAGVVRVADSLDMSKGRSRIPYEAGHVDIHSISAQSIESVEILSGREKPVLIEIEMHSMAGIFQVDELMKEKLSGSGIEKYIGVKVTYIDGDKSEVVKEY